LRETFLPFALPDLDGEELAEIKEALDAGWITTGPKTHRFEAEFGARVGAKHSIAVNSATAAMHIALEAIGLQRGDEVITTPYTFAATAEVVRYFDAKPVLVDVEATSLNIRPDLLECAITDKTRAIIPVHIAGLPADMDAIYKVANRHNLAVELLEDSARRNSRESIRSGLRGLVPEYQPEEASGKSGELAGVTGPSERVPETAQQIALPSANLSFG